MVNRRHKIIPIFLEDPKDVNIEDKNLVLIMKSVTYIIWPGEESEQKLKTFWENVKKSILVPGTTGIS